MPVTEISGLAGTIGGMQDPSGLQAFAEHLQRAKENQRQEALQQLNTMMQLTKESGGKWVPDAQVLEKLAKQAGLPKMNLTPGGGQPTAPTAPGAFGLASVPGTAGGGPIQQMPGAPMGAPGLAPVQGPPAAPPRAPGILGAFQAMGERYRKEAEVTDAEGRERIQKALTGELTQHARQVAADPKSSPTEVAQALTTRLMTGDMTLPDYLQTQALGQFTSAEKKDLGEVVKAGLLKKHTEPELDDMARNLAEQTRKDYDGDYGKAYAAAKLGVRGEPIPKDMLPPMTDDKLKRQIELYRLGDDMDLPRFMIQQMVQAGTADPGKLAELYGWNQDTLDLWNKAKSIDKQKLDIEKGRLTEEQTRTGFEKKRLDIEQERADSESDYRVFQSLKDLKQIYAEGKQSPQLEHAMKRIQSLREAQLAKQKVPQAAWDSALDELMQAQATYGGVPQLQKRDRGGLLGILGGQEWQWAPQGLPLPQEKAPGATSSTSRQQLRGLATDPFDPINKAIASIPGAGNKLFGALDQALDEWRGSGHTPTPTEIIQKGGSEVDQLMGKVPDLANRIADWIDKMTGVPPLPDKKK